MREILFRGKRTKTGQWVTGCLWHYNEKAAAVYSDELDKLTWVHPETVGQFTGLTDKNGKKIFEGDIIKGAWNTILIVFYDDISASYRVKTPAGCERDPSYYGIDRLEVIGNIHDDPELMEVSE